jgi:hypothetical protein
MIRRRPRVLQLKLLSEVVDRESSKFRASTAERKESVSSGRPARQALRLPVGADAVYFNVRLHKDRPCVLIVVGATGDGHNELLAIQDGEREAISAGCTKPPMSSISCPSVCARAPSVCCTRCTWRPPRRPQGLRVSTPGSCGDVHVLRLRGGARGAPAYDQPHRR